MALNKSDKQIKIGNYIFGQLPNIIIQVVDYKDQRYPTLGDWFFLEGDLLIKVSKQTSWQKEYLIALHELVEAIHCINDGISQKQIDDFDMLHSMKEINNDGWPEHGFHPAAPYKKQHAFAFIIEQLAAKELGQDLGSLVYGDFYKE